MTCSHDVAILMAAFNGDRYLGEQLDSLVLQSHRRWKLWVSDDGSTDLTLKILDHYSRRIGEERIEILQGPRRGAKNNFYSLLYNRNIRAPFYAYCDQDDIWEPDKLDKALSWLGKQNPAVPALYCSRALLINEHGDPIKPTPYFRKPPSFRNALVQNIAGGNTMVFNDAARNVLCGVPRATDLVIHDWWTYIAVTGAGGNVFFDSYPGVRYRQHDRNVIGMPIRDQSVREKLCRLLNPDKVEDANKNVNALMELLHYLTPGARLTFDRYVRARNGTLLTRMLFARRAGLYRVSRFGTVGLLVSVVLNRF